ncbi:MFS transporter [Actinomadura sp. NPDC047616]|uniref:MFS transporter n=1 Tax=Actinomadura sp. NPDC047616 TaxID=3155914 RepID=UPI0033E3E878
MIVKTGETAARAAGRSAARTWLGVGAVAAGTFTVITTEMLPVGLLTSVAATLGVSEGTAGLTVMLPGVVAALAAPVLASATARVDRRIVLCGLMALLAVANTVSALAPSLAVLLLARVLVGLVIGGFWAVAAGLAVRLVPERSVATATSVIFSGVAIASVVGVPAGTFLGEAAGWRTAFAVMTVPALVVLAALVLLLPAMPPVGVARLRDVPGVLLRNARVRVGLALTLLLVTGHFAAYTYVRPVLEEVGGIGAGAVGGLLLVYGTAGIIGNFTAGAAAGRDVRRTLVTVSSVLAAAVLAMPLLGTSPAGAVALLVVWGLAYGGVSVSVQTWFLRSGTSAPEAASAVFVSGFNGAIALGALLGGRIVDSVAVPGVLWTGGALAALAAATVLVFGRRS